MVTIVDCMSKDVSHTLFLKVSKSENFKKSNYQKKPHNSLGFIEGRQEMGILSAVRFDLQYFLVLMKILKNISVFLVHKIMSYECEGGGH